MRSPHFFTGFLSKWGLIALKTIIESGAPMRNRKHVTLRGRESAREAKFFKIEGSDAYDTDLWEFRGECPHCHKMVTWRATGKFFRIRHSVEGYLHRLKCNQCDEFFELIHMTLWGQAKLIERLVEDERK